MPILATGDIHFTDRPADEYRWGLLPWIKEQVIEHSLDYVALLGDITDFKDKHSSVLVNRVVDGIKAIAEHCPVIINKGNHDYIDEGQPFFNFISHMDNVRFYTRPSLRRMTIDGKKLTAFVLPSTRVYETEWADLDFNEADMIFAHQTFKGALVENGQEMDGIPADVFADFQGKVFSGDIHVPQKIGKKIEYAGAPYRIRYGDKFEPRVMLIDGNLKVTNLHYPCANKTLIEIDSLDTVARLTAKLKGMKPGDQIKVRVKVDRADLSAWPEMRKTIQKLAADADLVLGGCEPLAQAATASAPVEDGPALVLEPADYLRGYAGANKLDLTTLTIGLDILKQVLGERV